MKPKYIALLGDSIFDNARYVPQHCTVVDHLQRELGAGDRASLFATDGDTTIDVHTQLDFLPGRETHLVLSVGGNDALTRLSSLNQPVSTVLESLAYLQEMQSTFVEQYLAVLERISAAEKKALICTIYDAVPGLPSYLKTALSLYNDVITRCAMRLHLDILDIRDLLTDPKDFSEVSAIEPSEHGGLKLARAIAAWAHDTDEREPPE